MRVIRKEGGNHHVVQWPMCWHALADMLLTNNHYTYDQMCYQYYNHFNFRMYNQWVYDTM